MSGQLTSIAVDANAVDDIEEAHPQCAAVGAEPQRGRTPEELRRLLFAEPAEFDQVLLVQQAAHAGAGRRGGGGWGGGGGGGWGGVCCSCGRHGVGVWADRSTSDHSARGFRSRW